MIERIEKQGSAFVIFRLGSERYGLPIERVQSIIRFEQPTPVPRAPEGIQVFVAYIGDNTKEAAFSLVNELRVSGLAAMFSLGRRGLKAQMKLADRTGAAYAVIVGEGELADGRVQLRDMHKSSQELVPLEGLTDMIVNCLAKRDL